MASREILVDTASLRFFLFFFPEDLDSEIHIFSYLSRLLGRLCALCSQLKFHLENSEHLTVTPSFSVSEALSALGFVWGVVTDDLGRLWDASNWQAGLQTPVSSLEDSNV
jgi:hypothetical protein